MSSTKKAKSIVTKITWWYTTFIIILVTLMLGLATVIGINSSEVRGQQNLQRSALEMSHDIDDYENFDDGIYYVIYNNSGNVIKGKVPTDFKAPNRSSNEQIKEITVSGKTYQYFDTSIQNSSSWLRAIRLKTSLNHDMREVLISLACIFPFLIIAISFGGYKILKKALAPVTEMTEAAQKITKNHDYSKRIVVKRQDTELERLALTFNTMLASIERSFEREKQFNNDISHELRTPLAVILAESEYAKYTDDVNELKESSEIINRQALVMKEMITQILELSRLEANKKLTETHFDLAELIAKKVADQQKLFKNADLNLELQLKESIAPYYGDKVLLGRVVDNLLSNALKFAQSKVIVTLARKQQNYIFSVEDDGKGIKPDKQDKIWDKFYQVQKARNKEQTQGIGLGLSLVKDIVLLHQGSVQVQSKIGEKTIFTVVLPIDTKEKKT